MRKLILLALAVFAFVATAQTGKIQGRFQAAIPARGCVNSGKSGKPARRPVLKSA